MEDPAVGKKHRRGLLEYLEKKARAMNFPLIGQFELTPLCNLSCRMCYVHLTAEQLNGRPLLTAEQWKNVMFEAFSAGMLEVTLTGGECLTYPGFDELFLFLQDLGCRVSVLSNGLLLDEKRLLFFKEHPPASIQVTLYGNSEDAYERVTGSRVFKKVTGNLTGAAESGIPLYISVTPCRSLGEDVFGTIRLAYSLTKHVLVNASLFTPEGEEWRGGADESPDTELCIRIEQLLMELNGETPGAVVPLERLPEPSGDHGSVKNGLNCGGGRSSFFIDWQGNMMICRRMRGKEPVLQAGFQAAWERINHAALTWPGIRECSGCRYENVCNKCMAELTEYAGPGKRSVAYCEKIRYMVSRGLLPVSQCGPTENEPS